MLEKPRTSTPNIPHLAPYRHLLTVAAVLLVIGLAACSSISESGREGSGGESGEGPGHGEGGEGGEDGEGSEGGEGGGEESRNPLLPGQTFDMTRKGARLVLRYDATSQTFRGTVTNTTNAPLSRVRVEVHLAGGPELGPTEPMDLAPGETIMVSLDATGQNFSTWSPHAEVGPGSPVDPTGTSTFVPSLGDWAVIGGVDLGIEHKGHGLSAQHEWQGGSLDIEPVPGSRSSTPADRGGDMDGSMGRLPRVRSGYQYGRCERDRDARDRYRGRPIPPGRSEPRHAAVGQHAGHRRAVHGQHHGQLADVRRRGAVRGRQSGRRRRSRNGL